MMLVLALGTMAFSSCSNDDDESENLSLLWGAWKQVKKESYNGGKVVNESTSGWSYYFKRDGSLIQFSGSVEYFGSYKLSSSGKSLHLNYSGTDGKGKWTDDYDVEMIEISDSKLVWKKAYKDDEYDYQIYYFEKTTSKYDEPIDK